MKFRSKEEQDDRLQSRRPPNYYARSTQVRVLTLVFSLMLVIVLMLEARKPQNWNWMWAGSTPRVATTPPDEDIDTLLPPEPLRPEDPPGTVYANRPGETRSASTTELAAEISVVEDAEDARQRIRRDAWRGFLKQLGRDEREILGRILRNSRGGPAISAEDLRTWSTAYSQVDRLWKEYLTRANDAVLVAGDELPAEQRTKLLNSLRDLEIEWSNILGRALRAVLEDRPWTELEREALAKLQGTLDELASDAVRDDMVFRPDEQTAWFRSFEKLLEMTDSDLKRESLGNVGFVQLFRQTKEYRGRLVTVSGTAEMAHHVAAPKNDLGIERYYIFWLRPDDGSDAPIVAYALDLPAGFPNVGRDHTKLREEMTFTGYFFKRWAYGAQDGIRTAPLILARQPTWEPAPPLLSTELPSWQTVLIALSVLALIAIRIALWVYRAGGSQPAAQRSTPHEPTAKQFAAIAERKIGPTITEALQQRSEHEKDK